MTHSLTPTTTEQADAWRTFTKDHRDPLPITRAQVAALLGVNPVTVLQYEQAGKLRRTNERGAVPALIDASDFRDALRFLVVKRLLKKAASMGRAIKRPTPNRTTAPSRSAVVRTADKTKARKASV